VQYIIDQAAFALCDNMITHVNMRLQISGILHAQNSLPKKKMFAKNILDEPCVIYLIALLYSQQ
jgi:hypothetical protein